MVGPTDPRGALVASSQRALGAVLVAIVVALAFWRHLPERILFSNDMAITLAVARLDLAGEHPLAGPPSHLGGRHAGPVYYHALALVMLLAGGDVYRAILCLTAVKLGAMLSLLRLVPRVTEEAGWGRIGLLGALAAGLHVWVLRVPWHSNELGVLGTALIWATFAVARDGARCIPAWILAASLLVQTHLSAAPMILALGGAAAVALARRKSDGAVAPAGGRRLGAALLTLAVLSWVPTALFAWRHGPALADPAAIVGRPAGVTGSAEAARATLGFLKRFTFTDVPFAELLPLGRWGAILLAASFAWLVLRLPATLPAAERWPLGALVAVMAAYVPVLARLTPPVLYYYLQAAGAIPPLLVALLVGHAARTCRTGGRADRVAAAILLLLASLAASSACRRNLSLYAGGVPFPRVETLRHAQEVAAIIARDAGPGAAPALFVRGPSPLRENAVYLELGPQSYHLMALAGSFTELPTFAPAGKPDVGYLVTCEGAGLPTRRALRLELLDLGFVKVRQLDTEGCSTCATCAVTRLERSSP